MARNMRRAVEGGVDAQMNTCDIYVLFVMETDCDCMPVEEPVAVFVTGLREMASDEVETERKRLSSLGDDKFYRIMLVKRPNGSTKRIVVKQAFVTRERELHHATDDYDLEKAILKETSFKNEKN